VVADQRFNVGLAPGPMVPTLKRCKVEAISGIDGNTGPTILDMRFGCRGTGAVTYARKAYVPFEYPNLPIALSRVC